MGTQLYWIEGPWSGKLAVAPRPRGGDWLDDEIASWRASAIDTVVSLLTPDEERDLNLESEAAAAKKSGLRFLSLPIPDRQVPSSETEVAAILERVNSRLSSGKNVVFHCRQGVGRSGMLAACLLVTKGVDPRAAVKTVSTARGVAVPETKEQRAWVDHFASISASTK